MNKETNTVMIRRNREETELVVRINLSKVALRDDSKTQSIVKGFEAKQVEACLQTGELPKYLEKLGFEEGKKILIEGYKSSIKENIEKLDTRRLNTKEYDFEKFKAILEDCFKIEYKFGIDLIAVERNEESKQGTKNLLRIERNKIKLGEDKYLILADKEICYIDIKNDVTMKINIEDAKKSQIHIRHNAYNQCSVYYEKAKGSIIVLLKDGELIDTKKLNKKWKEKTQGNNKDYKTINFVIEGSIENEGRIKTHHLYMLLSTNALVMSLCTISGASILNIDHIDGNKIDNGEDNLQIITQSLNCKKRNLTTEEHLRFSKLYCYDYTLDLVLISEQVMKEIDDCKNRLN